MALARVSALGYAPILCAGDLLGDGPDHRRTIDLLERHDVVCVRGNHDRWVLDQGQTLSAEVRRFLEGLPRSWHGSFDGVRVAMVHGTPKSDMDGIYPAEASGPELQRWLRLAEADVLVVGHTHEPFRVAAPGGGVIVNPGVLLRDGVGTDLMRPLDLVADGSGPARQPPAGTFGVLDLSSRRFEVYRVADGSEVEIPRLARP